ncbi:thyroid adenoma-associated protein homolog [Haliotis rufescens]|uniref:thyroid adenoma-associated protein homolog n=1 Tax=Haliotis rufescens TaxID=6454 RepID=UPI00201F9EC4|nr:thyroid adenoma-associated protein homolog [Haliotis rufescens]XP_046339065.2 thyroid adenoma-associated protein homolog [Haliotis rufescens]
MATLQSKGENPGTVDTEALCASLLPVNNSKGYLMSLKEVLKTFKENVALLEREEIVKTLVEVYFECGPKFSAKRILASFLQGLPPEVGDRYQIELQIQLQSRIDTCLKLLTDSNAVRSLVEEINSLMENFRLGEACLKETRMEALNFLSHALPCFVDASLQKSSPVERNKTMHHCLATIKTANRLIQKCSVEASVDPCPGDTVQGVADRFLQGGLQILHQDDFLTDCRCGVGMVMVLVLKLSLGQRHIHLLLQSIFKTGVTNQEQITPITAPKLSVDLGVIHSLSLTSTLCLHFGLLAMVDAANAVLPLDNEGWILTSVFLDKLMALAPRCEDTGSKVLLAKAVTLWTTRTSTILESGVCPGDLTECLRGDGHVISGVLGYVWTTWDDQLDALRHNARMTFENCLKIHLLAAQSDPQQDKFVCQSTQKLLGVTWNNKGKYGCLGAAVGHIGCSTLLGMNPGIAAELLSQLEEQSLACYASDLYEKLFKTSHAELVVKESTNHDTGLSTWLSTWVDPVIHTLCQDNKRLKLHVIEYVLPRLLKYSRESLNYMISTLSSTDGQSRGQLGALVMCIRRARALGLLNSPRTPSTGKGDNPEMWYGLVSADVLRYALTCADEQIRLDAFALLCENLKMTEPITELELSLLRYFLPLNLNNQSPAFRQYLLAYLHKLLARLKESGATLTRLAGRNKQTSESHAAAGTLESYTSFLRWLQSHLFRNLYPGSAFARRLTSLAGLVLIIEVFPYKDGKELYQFSSLVDASHINTLMECLTDTFEENKVAAVRIMTFCFKHGSSMHTKSQLGSLFSAAMELSWSTKPHDCTTGSHIFQVLLQQPAVVEVMKAYVLDLKILSAPDSDQTTYCCPELMLLTILLLSLRDQTAVARKSLIVAAANRPMYPTMHCIRHILSDVDLRNIPDNILPHWRHFMEELMEACLGLARVVSPVVQDSSPEGNVPTEAIMGPGLNVDAVVQSEEEKKLLLEAAESEKMVTLMPEYLVVCCWRSIKEVSLILGQICLEATVGNSGFLSSQQILALGSYFTTQLLESKHRGAFELAYAGFVKMCEMLWRDPSVDLHGLPSKWLEEVMADIISDDPDSRLCATRRSAGVPFYVQALVTTEPTSTGRVCFKSAMTRLLMLALTQSSRTQMNNAQVHSLNILRALFRDTRLGEDVVPYIADGLKAAILGFKSQVWAVRNSSTLLLSALMTRIFGVKRSKDESAISKKNCQTGRAFFHRYPSLYQFLLSELDDATQDIDCSERLHLHPSLYPVLMVLGRLFPSSLEGADTHLNLAAFIPFVLKCASSPVFKTRLMAARALQPLAIKDQMTSLLLQLVARLPDKTANEIRQSHIHGVLLQMEHLLVLVPNMNSAAREDIMAAMLPRWLDVSWLTTRANNCVVTRTVALEICDHLLDIGQNTDKIEHSTHKLLDQVQLVLKQELLEKCQYSSHTPALSEFTTTLTHLCLKHYHDTDSKTWQTDNKNMECHVMTYGGQGQKGEGQMCQGVKGQGEGQSEVDMYSGSHCQENVVINLLGSEMYEVRLSVLRPLCRAFSQVSGRRGILSDEDREGECAGMTADTLKRLQRSEAIYRKLLDMALVSEWHHECLAMVYEVLYVSSSFDTTAKTTDVKTFELIVKKMKLEVRVEVKAAMLEFSGVFLPMMYNLVAQSKAADVAAVMEEWCRVFQGCSQTAQSADLQLCCASLLQQHAAILLLDPQCLLCQLTFDMWEVAIDLLQEDDLDVKETAALVLPALDTTKVYNDLQPTLVLERLMIQLSDHHGARDGVGCVAALTRWITESREEEQSEGVRLFDKGEMNSYREDILLVDLCCGHLDRLLTRETTDDDTQDLLPIFSTALQNQIKKLSPMKQVDRKTLFVETGDYQHQYETVYRSASLLRSVKKLSDSAPIQALCDELHSLINEKFEKKYQNYRLR